MSIKQDHIGDANKMVSSIEWLQAIELERDLTLADWNKAKAMHKEEIVDFAFQVGRGQDYDDEEVRELAKIVYNETFGE